jgi:hypothetical protein
LIPTLLTGCASLLFSIPVTAGSAGPVAADEGLFVATAESRAIIVTSDPTTFRRRIAAINTAQMPHSDVRTADTVRLNLFPDADFVGVVEDVDRRTSTRYTLTGRLQQDDPGRFAVAREGQAWAMDVLSGDGAVYEVRGSSNGTLVIRQVNEAAHPPCGFGPRQRLSSSTVRAAGAGAAVERDVQVTLDVMVVYTTEARIAAGGTDAMNALVQLFVAGANTTYANSLIHARMRLVYSGEVAYEESGSAGTDLNRLTFMNDGYLEEVHALRNQYGADVVSLLVNDFQYCGIGWMYFGPTRAFSVVDFGCGSATFVHEVGHNMGCAHDRVNANAAGHFSYSYGHRFTGVSGTQWRTVMSYAPGTRIQNFSNPAVLHDGVSTGIPEGSANSADNARTVNQTAPNMANYRAAADMEDCNGNFVPDAQDLANGASQDCNNNNQPDECDVVSGSPDLNGNEVPDECECDASACEDGNLCTLDRCDPDDGSCVFVTGAIPFGDLDFNGYVDVTDVNCALAGFEGASSCPQADVYPCGGNGYVDIADVLTVLNAYGGVFECPSECP